MIDQVVLDWLTFLPPFILTMIMNTEDAKFTLLAFLDCKARLLFIFAWILDNDFTSRALIKFVCDVWVALLLSQYVFFN